MVFAYLLFWLQNFDKGADIVPLTAKCTLNLPYLTEKCGLLIDIASMAVDLHIKAIQPRIVHEVGIIIDLANAQGFTTPISAATVQIVHDDIGEYSELWEVCMLELSRAFSAKPRVRFEDYKGCFQLEAFNHRIGNSMVDRIDEILEKNEVKEELKTQKTLKHIAERHEGVEDGDDGLALKTVGDVQSMANQCDEDTREWFDGDREESEEEFFETMTI